jgi:putative inorganic carbon (hco3(-)) transporter
VTGEEVCATVESSDSKCLTRLDKLARRLWRVELFALLGVAPVFIFPGLWTFLGIGVVGVILVVRRVATGDFHRRTALDLPLLALLVMATSALAIAPRPDLAVPKYCGLVLGLVLYSAIASRSWGRASLGRAALFIALVGVGLALLSLLGTDWQAAQLVPLPSIYARLPALVRGLPNSGVPRTSDLFNPREVGGALALVVPFLAAMCHQPGRVRLVFLMALLVTGAVTLLSQAMGAIAGIALTLPVIAAVGWRSGGRAARRAVIALAALLLTSTLVSALLVAIARPTPPGFLLPHLATASASNLWLRALGRLGFWQAGTAMLRDAPFTGIGLNNFTAAYQQLYPTFPSMEASSAHAHNMLLQIALDFGLPGLFAFLGILLLLVRRAARAMPIVDPQRRFILLGALGGLTAHFIFGVTDAVTLGAKPGWLLWVLIGICVVASEGVSVASGRRLRTMAPGSRRFALALVLPILIVALALLLWRPATANVAAIETQRALIAKRSAGGTGVPPATPGPALDLALRLDPTSPRLQRQRGMLAVARGDHRSAIPALQFVLATRADDQAARAALGDALYAVGHREEALAVWQVGTPWLAIARATDLSRNGDFAGAATLYRSARWRDARLGVDYCTREGAALVNAGESETAISVYRNCILLAPQRPGAYTALADLQVKAGDRMAARATLEEGVKKAQPPAPPAHQLAGMWLADNRPDLAEPLAALATSLAPSEPAYAARLGDVYAQQSRYEAAIAQYTHAGTLGATSNWRWLAPLRIGDIYLRQGRPQQAADQYRRVLSDADGKMPDTRTLATYYAQLGSALTRIGDPPGAVAALQRSLALNPENRSAQDQLAALLKP